MGDGFVQIFGKKTDGPHNSSHFPRLTKVYQAFKRKVSAFTRAVRQLFSSLPGFSGQPLSQRNVEKVKSDPVIGSVLVKPRKTSKQAQKTVSPSHIHVGKQKRGQQTCGTHAANTFLGGPVLVPVLGKPAVDDEMLLARMKEACANNGAANLPTPDKICLRKAGYTPELRKALKKLTTDRVILLPGLSTHYVTCIRSVNKHGEEQWYSVDSAGGGKVEEIEHPAAYLERIYQGQKIEALPQREQEISIIHLTDEKDLPGIVLG